MNYFITHCDINFIEHVEKLFESLNKFSNAKIIFYSIDFTYKNKYSNVISIRYDVDKNINDLDETKAYAVFLKPLICIGVFNLPFINKNDTFCYIDADCLAMENCDDIFLYEKDIIDYPLLNDGCHDYMILDGRGDPFINNGFDLNYTLEAPLINVLNHDINNRKQYLQTGVFVFNYECLAFLDLWKKICFDRKILSNWKYLTPFHEETVINCLLWQKNILKSLGQVLINIPYYNKEDDDLIKVKNLFNKLKYPPNETEFLYTFTKIPKKEKLKNVFFLHGKHSQKVYDFIQYNMSDLYLRINSPSLGDTIACTPTLRKLSKIYNTKINVITHVREVFLNNPYVNKIYSFEEFENAKLKIIKNNLFETFLGIGSKNQYGVEKKHNTIDIRQFHALDLGFMLHENELDYDYIADEYININDLPENYICIHVSNTWPSRTYSDEKYQQLIDKLNDNNIAIVLIGKNSSERGFYNIDKKTKNLNLKIGLDLTNKLNLSQCWHVINKSEFFITMDSGLLHLAGTTDAFIIQLGSSINNKLRAPYRNNKQDYKYKYISGPCNIFCASNIKYGIKEWGTIQGVPPLINCLENKNSFECHPSVEHVFDFINSNIKNSNSSKIEVFNIEDGGSVIHYRCVHGDLSSCRIKIFDVQTRTILYTEILNLVQGVNFWTSIGHIQNIITNDIRIVFYDKNENIIFDQVFQIYNTNRITPVSHLCFNNDLHSSNLYEIYVLKTYDYNNIKIEENDIVVDIGSNLSTFIHYALEKNASKVYSCEPTSYCFKIIEKYFKNNKKVILNNVAISDKNDIALFDIVQEGSGSNKLNIAKANHETTYISSSKEQVTTVTFKNFIEKNKIDKIDFLKVDCEGGESYIFIDENKDFFKKNVDKIAMEYHSEDKERIISYLKSLNYEVYENVTCNNEVLLGNIYAKNKNFKKIGLLLTAYNCDNYIDDCLKSWIDIKNNYNIKIAVNSGMFSDYKNLGFPNRNKETLEKLQKYKFDYFITTNNDDLLDEDSSRNKCLDYLIKEQKCDLIWILDGDEIYKKDEIKNIIEYINQNDAVYYSVTFKNYTFTKNNYSDFCPPRIFWTNKNLGINQFYFDNHILYNDNSRSEDHFNISIPKDVAYVDHYSWLAEDIRTQEKIKYQNLRFSGQEGARCSFIWDENYNCLKYNDEFYSIRNCDKPFQYQPPKYLFITPHLSTGGAPKYLEWLIQKTKKEENAQIKVIEWNLYSPTYIVQRDSIINIVGKDNFYTVGGYWENKEHFINKENEVLQIIQQFNPDYIHLNEFSEDFAIQGFTDNVLNFLYDKNRNFKLYETSHKAYIDFATKKYIPDELWLCSEYHINKAEKYNLNYKLVEMDLKKQDRPNRTQILLSLGLDPNILHVLQVGLFCKNKNQKFTFDVAKKMIDLPIQFHFIGNECYLEECGIDKNQLNCKIWGERKDVDVFMSCMDIFVMPSIEELNPISIKEALSWNMPCFISKIETLYNKYMNNNLVNFIEEDNFEKFLKQQSEKFIYLMQTNESNKINISFNPKPKVEILGDDQCIYKIKFIDNKTNYCHYQVQLQSNMWSETSIMYYVDWRIEVLNITRNVKNTYRLNLTNQIVHVVCDSSSLGDNIAWMSSIDEFQKKHQCKLYYYTNKKDLFEKNYPNINFCYYDDPTKNIGAYTSYKIGCFDYNDRDVCSKDWRLLNLCDIANDILGLEYKQEKPKIVYDKNYKHNLNKYVCIATQSTSQSRYWNKDKWEKVIAYLKNKGYAVICVDKHFSFGNDQIMNYCPSNVDLFAGHESFDKIISLIDNCEFFIGLSSGLSWLAWALNKNVLVISGSVEQDFEFKTSYRVTNKRVCNGCFNNTKYIFDKSNWMWCPENKNFECSENINHEHVIETIDAIINPNLIKKNLNLFSFKQI